MSTEITGTIQEQNINNAALAIQYFPLKETGQMHMKFEDHFIWNVVSGDIIQRHNLVDDGNNNIYYDLTLHCNGLNGEIKNVNIEITKALECMDEWVKLLRKASGVTEKNRNEVYEKIKDMEVGTVTIWTLIEAVG